MAGSRRTLRSGREMRPLTTRNNPQQPAGSHSISSEKPRPKPRPKARNQDIGDSEQGCEEAEGHNMEDKFIIYECAANDYSLMHSHLVVARAPSPPPSELQPIQTRDRGPLEQPTGGQPQLLQVSHNHNSQTPSITVTAPGRLLSTPTPLSPSRSHDKRLSIVAHLNPLRDTRMGERQPFRQPLTPVPTSHQLLALTPGTSKFIIPSFTTCT